MTTTAPAFAIRSQGKFLADNNGAQIRFDNYAALAKKLYAERAALARRKEQDPNLKADVPFAVVMTGGKPSYRQLNVDEQVQLNREMQKCAVTMDRAKASSTAYVQAIRSISEKSRRDQAATAARASLNIA